MSKKQVQKKKKQEWDLSLLYSSATDPKIEEDMKVVEKTFSDFAEKYDTKDKKYLTDDSILLEALTAYEKLHEYATPRPLYYFFFVQSLNGQDAQAQAQLALFSNRLAKASNLVKFFPISIGTLDLARQKHVLHEASLKHFRRFLERTFEESRYVLSVSEEQILSLKSLPAKEMWVTHNDKILDSQIVTWKGKKIPINKASEMVSQQKTSAARKSLAEAMYESLKSVAVFSEGEINAICTDKKINDELRGFDKPYSATVQEYQNNTAVVENLVKTVSDNFAISHRFGRIKAQLHKQKFLNYSDRGATIGKLGNTYSFDRSIELVKSAFATIDKKYADYLDQYLAKGQIDVFPKQGKTGGAFCASSSHSPTFVLLNHVDSLRSFTTIAHEMGHAFHSELSRDQGPMYCEYSYALGETASTLFEYIAFDSVFETLTKQEKIVALHDKINNSVSTIMRQIACFNFELDLHNAIRTKGFVPKEEIAMLHNKHMQAYLGPAYKMAPNDGYMFVSWGHIRRFFYVYSYAFGLIVSQGMLRRYRKDKSFWTNIERFLSAGGKDTPENILKEIGIDVTKPDFFRDGLKAIEDDIDKLESLL